jgi:hypothetical protein
MNTTSVVPQRDFESMAGVVQDEDESGSWLNAQQTPSRETRSQRPDRADDTGESDSRGGRVGQRDGVCERLRGSIKTMNDE